MHYFFQYTPCPLEGWQTPVDSTCGQRRVSHSENVLGNHPNVVSRCVELFIVLGSHQCVAGLIKLSVS